MNRLLFAAALCAVTLHAAPGRAQDAARKQRAAALFAEGRALVGKPGKLDEACAKFQESYAVMERGDTVLNLAECHRLQGKTATAWKDFGLAAEFARKEKFPAAEKVALERRADLDARLSFLILTVAPETAALPGFELTLNGYPVPREAWGKPVPVDPGSFEIAGKAEGHQPFAATTKVTLDGERREVAVTLTKTPVIAPPPEPPPPAPPPPPPPAKPAVDPNDPFEDPGRWYRFIGVRFRDAVVPKLALGWFADGGRTVNVPMVGPEFILRRNHLEIAVSLMYADYGMAPTLFKGKSDPDTAFELISSTLKLGYGMVDVLYEIPLEKKGERTGRIALLIGGGVGVAGVFGSLYRTQAYPNARGADPGSPSQWSACRNANDGQTGAGAGYCADPPNSHYWPGWSAKSPGNVGAGAYNEASWANGGSKPMVYPWLALPQVSFRYKPVKQFQSKVDVGFSSTGFFFGVSASYGL